MSASARAMTSSPASAALFLLSSSFIPARCSVRRVGKIMRSDRVTPVAVKLETLASALPIGLVDTDDLDEPLETTEERRPFGAQIQQQLIVERLGTTVIDDDRRYLDERVVRFAMWDETDGGRGPEQSVDMLRGLSVGATYEHGVPASVRFRDDAHRRLNFVCYVR